MELNIGTITTDECSQAISTIEELKVKLAKTKDVINEKAYKVVYYALCKLQDGIDNMIKEKEDGVANEPLITDIKHTE